jgi:hypothetical protein
MEAGLWEKNEAELTGGYNNINGTDGCYYVKSLKPSEMAVEAQQDRAKRWGQKFPNPEIAPTRCIV